LNNRTFDLIGSAVIIVLGNETIASSFEPSPADSLPFAFCFSLKIHFLSVLLLQRKQQKTFHLIFLKKAARTEASPSKKKRRATSLRSEQLKAKYQ
jgi:hypothetical protein